MKNTLKEEAEPKQSKEVYTAQEKSNLGAATENFTMSTPVIMGGLETSVGKSPSYAIWMVLG